jgi:ABC-2 type transport system permease protein
VLRSVLTKTLRDQRRPLVWWGVGVTALVLLEVLVYPTVRDKPELNKLVQDYPDVLKALIGAGENVDFLSGPGYLTTELFSFLVPLILLILAIGMGAGAIAGEEERGTLDLLLAHPVSRSRVVGEKFAALTLVVSALGVVLVIALWASAAIVDLEISVARLAEASAAAVFLAVAYGTLALLAGCVTGRRSISIGATAALAFAAYVLNSLGTLVGGLEPYRKLSPFYHYAAGEPLRNGLGAVHVAVLLGIAAALALLAVVAFERRDVAV